MTRLVALSLWPWYAATVITTANVVAVMYVVTEVTA